MEEVGKGLEVAHADVLFFATDNSHWDDGGVGFKGHAHEAKAKLREAVALVEGFGNAADAFRKDDQCFVPLKKPAGVVRVAYDLATARVEHRYKRELLRPLLHQVPREPWGFAVKEQRGADQDAVEGYLARVVADDEQPPLWQMLKPKHLGAEIPAVEECKTGQGIAGGDRVESEGVEPRFVCHGLHPLDAQVDILPEEVFRECDEFVSQMVQTAAPRERGQLTANAEPGKRHRRTGWVEAVHVQLG